MAELNGRQKRKLKSLAHHLKPVVQIGQKGLTEALVKAVDRALTDHELIKVKFVDFKDEKHELASGISSGTGADLIDIIGNIAIFYRENPDIDDGMKIRPGR